MVRCSVTRADAPTHVVCTPSCCPAVFLMMVFAYQLICVVYMILLAVRESMTLLVQRVFWA